MLGGLMPTTHSPETGTTIRLHFLESVFRRPTICAWNENFWHQKNVAESDVDDGFIISN